VDASGYAGVLRKALGVRAEYPTSLQNIAIWDYWNDAEWAVRLGTEGTRVQVLSLSYGWMWFIPITARRTSVWCAFGNPTERPIFVLGMIRSGTTLMEQMLTAHPDVAGAGEQHFWIDEAHKCLDLATTQLVPERMAELSAQYLQVLDRTVSTTRFVTDKMPGNVGVLGFIHACLPNAKIICMNRDPIDTCLSIWTTHMYNPPDFGSHKGNIIRAFRLNERLLEHWNRVLPADRFLQVCYEELTSQPETVMRRVPGVLRSRLGCGLPPSGGERAVRQHAQPVASATPGRQCFHEQEGTLRSVPRRVPRT